MIRNGIVMRGGITFILALTFGVVAEAGTIRRVDLNATGTPVDGSTWARAYRHLQDALALSSSGDEIWVAQGTYTPDPTNTNVSFALISGVKVKGGYAGVTETNPDDNDPVAYLTILSGDLAGDDSTGCALNDSGNSKHVVTAGSVTIATILEGFVITRGNAGGDDGGGLQITSQSAFLQVINCHFTCNRAEDGGGVFHGNSRSSYSGCTFEDNLAHKKGGGLWSGNDDVASTLTMTDCSFLGNVAGIGGAVAAEYVADATYAGCLFLENIATHTTAESGGAISHLAVSDALVSACTFDSNEAGGGGGAIYSESSSTVDLAIQSSSFSLNEAGDKGGAVYNNGPTLSLRSTEFASNEAESNGGAVFNNSTSPLIVDCQFNLNSGGAFGGAVYSEWSGGSSTLTLVNTRFQHNEAGFEFDGGGLYVNGSDLDATNCLWAKNVSTWDGGAIVCSGNTALLTNCTIADNTATNSGAGIFCQSSATCTLKNCILWGNSDTSGFTTAAQITGASTLSVTYSNVMGGVLSGGGQSNNISTDPWFVDPDNDNYRIRLCSVCLDACDYDTIDDDVHDVDGDPANNGDATPDLDLLLRAVDRPNITDTGVGTYTFTDMGAFENCIGDANGDQKINGLDIQPFVNCLLDNPAESDVCDCADSTLDGELTLDDVPCFVSVLLGVTDGCYTCAEGGLERGIADCNENEVPDANDIAESTSQDCNGNFIPDECDIAAETSVDVDENGVPDECQADCNGNDVPDEKDIADEESLDCNENGIPDECERDCNSNGVPDDCDLDPEDPDGDEWVSADCNTNGVPDECEDDCNENGVPDDCDVDPEDPDGDEWVSPDCNENGYPDECDLTLPPGLGSYDCNENEIPDECDIADETSCDANANDVPDECDILLEECVDANEDECCDEEESLMGGGESMMSSSSEGPCAELTEAECWAVFHDWAMQQCWGPQCESTGFEQFQSARAKLAELGLLFGNPES